MLRAALSFLVLGTVLSLPALADPACASGNLSSLIGTTCDIGNLQFQFSSWSAADYTFDSNTNSLIATASGPAASAFTFTADSYGFTLSGSPMSVTGPGSTSEYSYRYAFLAYTVTDMGGDITGEHVTDNGLSATGSNDSVSEVYGLTYQNPCCTNYVEGYDEAYQYGGNSGHYGPQSLAQGSLPAGSSYVYPYELVAWGNDSAAWNGSTSVAYDLTNVAEPGSVVMFGLGLLIVGLAAGKGRLAAKPRDLTSPMLP